MNRTALLALLVAALLPVLAAAPALAAPKLRATIAQATPTPTATPANGGELSDEPPNLGEEEEPEVSGGGSDAPSDSDLPNTGADSLMLALMGLGMLVTGLGLRRRVAHAGLAR